jgi:hypothetical protein
LYAFGEIVLIVLGILIAVQIGKWNELKKLEEDRLILIEDLKTDMLDNFELLENRLQKGEKAVEALEQFLEYSIAIVMASGVSFFALTMTQPRPAFDLSGPMV